MGGVDGDRWSDPDAEYDSGEAGDETLPGASRGFCRAVANLVYLADDARGCEVSEGTLLLAMAGSAILPTIGSKFVRLTGRALSYHAEWQALGLPGRPLTRLLELRPGSTRCAAQWGKSF